MENKEDYPAPAHGKQINKTLENFRSTYGHAYGTLLCFIQEHGDAAKVFQEHPSVTRYLELKVACVAPEYGKRGIGRRLFELALDIGTRTKEEGGLQCGMAYAIATK